MTVPPPPIVDEEPGQVPEKPKKKAFPKPREGGRSKFHAKSGLNAKQNLFAHEYGIDFNATQAAIRAGYKATSAHVIGNQLLAIPQVRTIINRRRVQVTQRIDVSAERIDLELARIAFFDIGTIYRPDGTLMPIHEMPEDSRRAISSIDSEELTITKGGHGSVVTGMMRKLKGTDKIRALELLGKRLNLFQDQIQVDVTVLTDEQRLEQARALEAKVKARILSMRTARAGPPEDAG